MYDAQEKAKFFLIGRLNITSSVPGGASHGLFQWKSTWWYGCIIMCYYWCGTFWQRGEASYDGEGNDNPTAIRAHRDMDGDFQLGLFSIPCCFYPVLSSFWTRSGRFLNGINCWKWPRQGHVFSKLAVPFGRVVLSSRTLSLSYNVVQLFLVYEFLISCRW